MARRRTGAPERQVTPLEAEYTGIVRDLRRTSRLARIMLVIESSMLVPAAVIVLVVMLWHMGYEVDPLTGISMTPTHSEGDAIIIDTDVKTSDLDLGDIIVFTYEGDETHRVCHRVFARETDASGRCVITTKGDHNECADIVRTTDDNLVGRVVLSVPRLGVAIWHIREIVTAMCAILVASATTGIIMARRQTRIAADLAKLQPVYELFWARNLLRSRGLMP
jgi:signal peptidase